MRQGFEPWVQLLGPYNGLANRRLQPLGHLTAARKLSIQRDLRLTRTPIVPSIVPEIVPASAEIGANGDARASGALIRRQRFFSPTTMPATDWRTLLYSHEPASTFWSVVRRGREVRADLARERAGGGRRSSEPLTLRERARI